MSDAFLQDMFGVNRALQGERNLGQQTIEFAINGYDDYEKALKVFKAKLPGFLSLKK